MNDRISKSPIPSSLRCLTPQCRSSNLELGPWPRGHLRREQARHNNSSRPSSFKLLITHQRGKAQLGSALGGSCSAYCSSTTRALVNFSSVNCQLNPTELLAPGPRVLALGRCFEPSTHLDSILKSNQQGKPTKNWDQMIIITGGSRDHSLSP